MPKYNINLITARKSYYINEIVPLWKITRKTCELWIKQEGLKTIEGTSPFMIRGADLIDFIKEKRAKGKIPVKENEFLCMKCRQGVKPKAGSEQILKTGKRIGRDNHEQLRKTGICEKCETRLYKFL